MDHFILLLYSLSHEPSFTSLRPQDTRVPAGEMPAWFWYHFWRTHLQPGAVNCDGMWCDADYLAFEKNYADLKKHLVYMLTEPCKRTTPALPVTTGEGAARAAAAGATQATADAAEREK